MTKTKTAAKRLSLTMPGPADSQAKSKSVSSPENEVRPSNRPGTMTTGLRRPETRNKENRPAPENLDQDPVSSRSISPSAPFSAGSDHSTSSPTSPGFTSLPQFPPSPGSNSNQSREQSRSFFQNFKASKSSAKIQPADSTIRRVPVDDQPGSPHLSKTKSTPDLRGSSQADPVPDLPRLDRDEASQRSISSSTSSHTIPRRPVGAISSTSKSNLSQSEPASQSQFTDAHDPRKNGKLFPNFMKRANAARPEDGLHGNKPGTPVLSRAHESSMKPASRDRSVSRHTDDEESQTHSHGHSHSLSNERKTHRTQHLKDQRSQSFRDGMGSKLITGFKAAKDMGKAGKGFFKHRNTAMAPTPPDYMTYHCAIINMPLVDQTRMTRIAKRLEDSKDKTEFWMPALPWRCIDFLNYTGCETEGLYRVPGSEREVKMWKYRFDKEYDINLFEEEELHDINAIGSLFKSWLRELPDDVFPQNLQESLSAKYSGQEKAPEEVKEVLSALPPWNYYLLFAITCHLSLLNAYADKNKMTFSNLFICFSNSLRLNADCFRWLVADWRSCWKGCITEKGALEGEYRLIENYNETFDSDTSSQDTQVNEQESQASVSIHEETTPKAETFLSSHDSAMLSPPSSSKGPKESLSPLQPSLLYTPSTFGSQSHESLRQNASRDGHDTFPQQARISSPLPPGTPGHQRSASQLPEFDFGKPISPTFASKKRDSAATYRQT